MSNYGHSALAYFRLLHITDQLEQLADICDDIRTKDRHLASEAHLQLIEFTLACLKLQLLVAIGETPESEGKSE
jgi:hypothetical protein